MLHLGALDESLVRSQDLYICIKTEKDKDSEEDISESNSPKLYAVWRSTNNATIMYHQLDPNRDSLSPLSIEMLAEDLPQLLQNLLVGVERAICRVPLDDLTFPATTTMTSATESSDNKNDVCDSKNENFMNEGSLADTAGTIISLNNNKLILSPINLPKKFECGIKRREIITKYNSKYSLKRVDSSSNTTNSNNKSEVDAKCSLIVDNGDENIITSKTTNETTAAATSASASASAVAAAASTSNTPLFCLGDSFPHIDSDEESVDDMNKIETGM